MSPWKSRYSSGWSSVRTARRLSFGSSGRPLGIAHDASAPSCSRRRSQCRRVAWCSWMTKRGWSAVAAGAPAGSGVASKSRFVRYVFRRSATPSRYPTAHEGRPATRRTALAPSAAGDRGQDLHLVAVGDRRVEAVGEADVLAVDVDVDEAPQRAVAVRQAIAQLAVTVEQRVEHLAHGPTVHLELGLAAGRGPQLGRDLDLHRHQTCTPAPSTCATNSSYDGAISCAVNVPLTASSVLRPSPVMTRTTRSAGSMSPRSASFASTAVVVPPAVSVQTPVVSASRRMPARISSSVT